MRADRERLRYIRAIIRKGPTETGYAYFRARRRRRNIPDDDLQLSEADLLAVSGAYDFDERQLAAHEAVLQSYDALERVPIRSVQWFLPYFGHAYFGGVHT